jgi:hypothetical protein
MAIGAIGAKLNDGATGARLIGWTAIGATGCMLTAAVIGWT